MRLVARLALVALTACGSDSGSGTPTASIVPDTPAIPISGPAVPGMESVPMFLSTQIAAATGTPAPASVDAIIPYMTLREHAVS